MGVVGLRGGPTYAKTCCHCIAQWRHPERL